MLATGRLRRTLGATFRSCIVGFPDRYSRVSYRGLTSCARGLPTFYHRRRRRREKKYPDIISGKVYLYLSVFDARTGGGDTAFVRRRNTAPLPSLRWPLVLVSRKRASVQRRVFYPHPREQRGWSPFRPKSIVHFSAGVPPSHFGHSVIYVFGQYTISGAGDK